MAADHIDRAAEVIAELVDAEDAAHVLDAEGLLVTPAHDAEVAARAWDEGHRAAGIVLPTDPPKPARNPYREWGGSDAHA